MRSEDLRWFDGRAGRPAYVAHAGVVYDVSPSFLWMGGKHQVLHHAGRDLTREMSEAPHDASVFEGFRVVGVLDRRGEPTSSGDDSDPG